LKDIIKEGEIVSMGDYKILEKFTAIITLLNDQDIYLKDCDTYVEAYRTMEDYISDMDEVLWDAGESMFLFLNAKIEKRFIREWVK